MIYLYSPIKSPKADEFYQTLLLDGLEVEYQIGGEVRIEPKYDFSFGYGKVEDYSSTFIVFDDNIEEFYEKVKKSIYARYNIEEIQFFKVFNREKELETIKNYSNDLVKINYSTINLDSTVSITTYKGFTKLQRENLIAIICKVFGDSLYAFDKSSLQRVLVDMLTIKNKNVACAESITGGLVGAKIVDISGASKVFSESCVTYSNKAKQNRLSVLANTIGNYTAVSEQVCAQMVKGCLFTSGADYAVSTTGYAQRVSSRAQFLNETTKLDDENTVDFSVGLCYIGVASNEKVDIYKYNFSGSRQNIRNCAANAALFHLIKMCKKY